MALTNTWEHCFLKYNQWNRGTKEDSLWIVCHRCPQLETFSVMTFKYHICESFSSGQISLHAELQQGKQVDVYPSPLVALGVSVCRPTHTLGLCSDKVPCLMNTLDSYIVAKKPCRWRRRASIRFLSYSLQLHEQTWARGRRRAEERSETEWQRGQDVTNICAMCQITARAVNWQPRCRARCFFFFLTSAILIPVQKCSRTTVAKRLHM